MISHISHTEMYMKEVHSLACDGNATPVVVKETPSTALVDARNGLGSVRKTFFSLCTYVVNIICYFQVAGTFCMQLAIEKAKKTGIAWVTCART